MERKKGTQPGGPDAGFSLLEVMVGVAVLVGGLMGLGLAMITAYRLDRMTTERKIALAFASSQIERIRGMTRDEVKARPKLENASPADAIGSGGYLPDTSWGSVAVGTSLGSGSVGFREDVDSDGDEDFFGLYFTRQTPQTGGWYSDSFVTVTGGWIVKVSDSRLNALTPQPTRNGKMAQVTFREPDGTTGLVEKSGFWVTVKVFWQGSNGTAEEEKLSTFVSL